MKNEMCLRDEMDEMDDIDNRKEIRDSVTVEFHCDSEGFINEQCTEPIMLSKISTKISGVIAILSDMPKEIGLYKFPIVIRDKHSISVQTLKLWIVPTVKES